MPMEIIIGIYFIIVIAMFFVTIEGYNDIEFTPKDVYETYNLNIVGSCIVWIIQVAFDPLLYIIKMLDWLLHVGRKD